MINYTINVIGQKNIHILCIYVLPIAEVIIGLISQESILKKKKWIEIGELNVSWAFYLVHT